MNNNLISEATDLLKTATLTRNPEHFIDAMNKISMSISNAVTPMNMANMPFIAASLSRYLDILVDSLNSEQLAVYSAVASILKNGGAECVVTIPIPTKGDKK